MSWKGTQMQTTESYLIIKNNKPFIKVEQEIQKAANNNKSIKPKGRENRKTL